MYAIDSKVGFEGLTDLTIGKLVKQENGNNF